MSNDGECGMVFNRHRWRYLDSQHRICVKCGECYSKQLRGIDHVWILVTYDEMMVHKIGRDKHRKNKAKADFESRQKALGYW